MASTGDERSHDPLSDLWSALEEYEEFVSALRPGASDVAVSDTPSSDTAPAANDGDAPIGVGATRDKPASSPATTGPDAASQQPPARSREHQQGVAGQRDRDPSDARNGARGSASAAADAPRTATPARPRHAPAPAVAPVAEEETPVHLDAEITLPQVPSATDRRAAQSPRPAPSTAADESDAAVPSRKVRPAPTAESPGWRPVPTSESPGWRPVRRDLQADLPRSIAATAHDPATGRSADARPASESSAALARRSAVRDVDVGEPGTARSATRIDGPGVTDDGASTPEGRDGRGYTLGMFRSSGGDKRGGFLRELPVLLVVALILAFLLRTFVVQVFYIPSSSMEPTLQVDDRMVVEKITYRFREPQRGEIVVFEGAQLGVSVGESSTVDRAVRGVGQFLGIVPASARDFVKRVIGLPGDEIELVDGQVFVNGAAIAEPYVVFGDDDNFGPVAVPDGQLFFLGDNRPNSSDSRRSLGFVAIDDVVGRAAVIIWPPSNTARLTTVRHDAAKELRASADALEAAIRPSR